MKLSDLNPKWIQPSGWVELAPPFYIGLSFDCPCPSCRKGACPTCGHVPQPRRLAVNFWPPIDPTQAMGRLFNYQPQGNPHTRASGEAIDTLTITPSIGFDSIGHWHGNITNGEATP